MGNVLVNSSSLSAIANAIRNKNGSIDKYKPKDMAKAINDIDIGATPTGTKEISIAQNGTITENVSGFASAEITANVPNSYSASDEGKVVNNGLLVEQTSAEYTLNNTYDTTLIDEVTVNVGGGITPTGTKQISISQNGTTTEDVTNYTNAEITVNVSGGGGFTLEQFYSQQYPSGNFTFTGTTMSVTPLQANTAMTKFTAPNLTTVAANFIRDLSNLQYVVLSSCTKVEASGIAFNTNLLGIDWFGGSVGSMCFANNSKLTTMVIRKTSAISSAAQTNMFNKSISTNKPLHVYVPSALKSTYESDTNWSTWVNAGTVIFHDIEGSEYETKYVDGTTIPTT